MNDAELCNKPMPPAINGVDRGLCTRSVHHNGRCGSRTCHECGAELNEQTATAFRIAIGSGPCKKCALVAESRRTHAVPGKVDGGKWGAHLQHHVRKTRSNPTCSFCQIA